jgi:hypothetical protein
VEAGAVAHVAVQKAFGRVAAEAAERFTELVDSGEEVPFEIEADQNGGALPLYQYSPLTERFILDHVATIRDLESFVAAKRTLSRSEAVAKWLEQAGIPVPVDASERAEAAVVAFLNRLWADSADFTVDDERLAEAMRNLEEGSDPISQHAVEIVVPLAGMTMPGHRLELGDVTLIRTDSQELPVGARSSEGMGRSPWDPGVVAMIGGDDAAEVAGRAERAFDDAVTAMRLLKPGGVALGPQGWARKSSGEWRATATGATRPRPGGYVISESEGLELAELTRALAERRPDGPLAWAIQRFEVATEQQTVLDGLSDCLLALRALFDAGSGLGAGFPTRVAAATTEIEERRGVRAMVERALELERRLMSDGPPGGEEGEEAQALAGEVEDLARGILRRSVQGEVELGEMPEPEVEPLDEDQTEDDAPKGSEEETGVMTAHELGELAAQAATRAATEALTTVEPPIEPETPEPDEEENMARKPRMTDEAEVIELRWPDKVIERDIEGPLARRERSRRVGDFFPRPEVGDWSVPEFSGRITARKQS